MNLQTNIVYCEKTKRMEKEPNIPETGSLLYVKRCSFINIIAITGTDYHIYSPTHNQKTLDGTKEAVHELMRTVSLKSYLNNRLTHKR